MKKRIKFSFGYFFLFFLSFMIIQWVFFPTAGSIKEMPYSIFKSKLAAGEISRVLVLNDKIIGELKDKKSRTSDTTHALEIGPSSPLRMRIRDIEDRMQRQFYTVRLPGIDDPELTRQLAASGVEVTGRIENHTVRNFILNWILPFLVIMIVYMFLFRRVFRGGNNILEIGKTKARIYADAGVTTLFVKTDYS